MSIFYLTNLEIFSKRECFFLGGGNRIAVLRRLQNGKQDNGGKVFG